MQLVIPATDDSHDPKRRSWVQTANDRGTDFPIQNLPFGVFRTDPRAEPRVGVAIGPAVLDLHGCAQDGLLSTVAPSVVRACTRRTLFELMASDPTSRPLLRHAIQSLLDECAPRKIQTHVARHLSARARVEMLMPATVRTFTDFLASLEHATNVSRVVAGAPVAEAFHAMPIGYHGHPASIAVSPTPVRRPWCIRRSREGVRFSPSRRLDFELELGCFLGPASAPGWPLSIDQAQTRLFGICLLNDWTARDAQVLERDALGPLLSKSFATSLSPWIVTAEALAPFRCAQRARVAPHAVPLSHLVSESDGAHGALSVMLDVRLQTAAMRQRDDRGAAIVRADSSKLYWTPGQLITHLSSNGAPITPGDLIGTGTISGPSPEVGGCLLEISGAGTQPVRLPAGESRTFLEDDDEVTFTGVASRNGFRSIGFGKCTGRVVPARL